MDLTVDQITANFTHNFFPIIEGKPDYQIICNMWNLLCRNTSTLLTTLGWINQSHIGLVMWDKLYATISPTPYNASVDPGGTSHVPAQGTKAVLLQLWDKTRRQKSITYMTIIITCAQKSRLCYSKQYTVRTFSPYITASRDTWGHQQNISWIIS